MVGVMSDPQYRTLVEYMEMTGTTAQGLCALANDKLRGSQKMSRSLFSYILRGSRRCSGEKAWALHQITGVPMEELTRWPREPHSSDLTNSDSVTGPNHVKY